MLGALRAFSCPEHTRRSILRTGPSPSRGSSPSSWSIPSSGRACTSPRWGTYRGWQGRGPCLRFGCIPGLSAHTRIWENNPPGRGGGRWGSSVLAGAPLRPPLRILVFTWRLGRIARGWRREGVWRRGSPRRDGLMTSGPGPCRNPRRPFQPGRRRRPAAWPRRPRRRST